MEGNKRDEEEIHADLVVEVVLMVNFSLFPFPFASFPYSSCADDFPAKKNVNNHLVEMQKDPTSCLKTIEKNFLYGTVSRISHHYILPRHQITCHMSPCSAIRPGATTVQEVL